jgi:hypothetical protein
MVGSRQSSNRGSLSLEFCPVSRKPFGLESGRTNAFGDDFSAMQLVRTIFQKPIECPGISRGYDGSNMSEQGTKISDEAAKRPYTAADLRQIHIASGTNAVAGLWLVIAPRFLCSGQPLIQWNDAIAGTSLIVLASLRYVHPLHRFWISWFNAFIGLWLTASPFILGCQHISAQVNDTTLGFVVFVAGAVSGSVRSWGR